MERFEVQPDGDGIVSVRHHLDTTEVQVHCKRTDGSPVGYRWFNVVSRQEVEVVTVPESGVAAVIITARDATR